MSFTPAQQNRYLAAATQLQENLRLQFEQNNSIVISETMNMRAQLLAAIPVIEAQQTADVLAITEQAHAQALQLVTNAQSATLASLYDSLGFNSTQQKLAYFYISQINKRQGHNNTRFFSDLAVNGLLVR